MDELVSVGLVDMTDAEHGLLRLGVGEGVRDVPVTQFADWQLAAVHSVLSEQIAAPWAPGPKESDPKFLLMQRRANEIAREMEKRRSARRG